MSPFALRHQALITPQEKEAERKALKNKIRTAIAWGVPDRESTGYSAGEFVNLLHKALKEIEALEAELKVRS